MLSTPKKLHRVLSFLNATLVSDTFTLTTAA